MSSNFPHHHTSPTEKADMKTTPARVIASVLSFALCVGMCASPIGGVIAGGFKPSGGGGADLGYAFDTNDWNRFSGGGATADPTEYTISAWVKATTVAGSLSIVVRSDGNPSSAFSHQICLGASRFAANVFDGSSRVVSGTTSPSAGVWYHVATTAKNGSVVRLYVNGVEEGSAAAVGTMWTGGNDWWIARATGTVTNNGAPGAWNGDMCDVAVWSKELTAGEIATLASGNRGEPLNVQAASLVLFCSMADVANGVSVSSNWAESVGGLTQTRTSTPVGVAVTLP